MTTKAQDKELAELRELDCVILDHSSLDAVVADLNRYRLLDSRFCFRGVESRVFGLPWELFEVETDGQTVCLLVTGHRPLNLKYMGGIIGQPPLYPPTNEFRLKDGAAVQIWVESPPSSASVDGAQRRLHENLRGVFA